MASELSGVSLFWVSGWCIDIALFGLKERATKLICVCNGTSEGVHLCSCVKSMSDPVLSRLLERVDVEYGNGSA